MAFVTKKNKNKDRSVRAIEKIKKLEKTILATSPRVSNPHNLLTTLSQNLPLKAILSIKVNDYRRQ